MNLHAKAVSIGVEHHVVRILLNYQTFIEGLHMQRAILILTIKIPWLAKIVAWAACSRIFHARRLSWVLRGQEWW